MYCNILKLIVYGPAGKIVVYVLHHVEPVLGYQLEWLNNKKNMAENHVLDHRSSNMNVMKDHA